MPSDPLASIRSWPIVITLAGSEFTVPPQSAATWLSVLLDEPIRAMDLIPGLLSEEDQMEVADLLADGDLSLEEINEVCLDLIGAASGKDWWWTMRLLSVAIELWPLIFGQVAGLNLEKIPLGAFLDRVYYLCICNLSEDKRKLLDLELETVPEGVEVTLDEDAESRAFMKMMEQAQQF